MPSYDEQFLDCPKTIEDYVRYQKKATGYSKHMLGRRESDFVYTYTLQQMNIHTVRLSVSSDKGDYEVCSCGLKNFTDHENHLVRGHLFNGRATRQIIVWHDGVEGYALYCQDCEDTWFLESRGEYEFYGLPDVDVEATLAMHSHCGKPTAQPFEPDLPEEPEYPNRPFGPYTHDPIKLPLINQEPDEIAFRESFRTKAEQEFDDQ